MRVTRQPLVLVSDERLEVIGLVTLEDVLDEVVGRL
jgi:CBS domain containing-hemolysin-like protein